MHQNRMPTSDAYRRGCNLNGVISQMQTGNNLLQRLDDGIKVANLSKRDAREEGKTCQRTHAIQYDRGGRSVFSHSTTKWSAYDFSTDRRKARRDEPRYMQQCTGRKKTRRDDQSHSKYRLNMCVHTHQMLPCRRMSCASGSARDSALSDSDSEVTAASPSATHCSGAGRGRVRSTFAMFACAFIVTFARKVFSVSWQLSASSRVERQSAISRRISGNSSTI